MNPTWTDGPNLGNIQQQTTSATTIHHVTINTDHVNERTPLLLNGTVTQNAQTEPQYLYRDSTYIHVLFMAALSMFLIIGVGTAVYLLISEGTDWITWSTYSLVRRSDWKAENSIDKLVAYDKEITEIMITSTKTTSCWTERQCCDIVRNLQKNQIHALKEPDIIYNFLIGNDGQIYEGTGWKTKLEMSNKNKNNTIIVALIGDSNNDISDIQLKTTKTLFDVSVNRKLINKCVTILVHYDFKFTDYFLINFAADLQRYVNRFCTEKLLFY